MTLTNKLLCFAMASIMILSLGIIPLTTASTGSLGLSVTPDSDLIASSGKAIIPNKKAITAFEIAS